MSDPRSGAFVQAQPRPDDLHGVRRVEPPRTASHFTTLRILAWLKHLGQKGERAPTDFLSVQAIHEPFESQGFSTMVACVSAGRTIHRLVRLQFADSAPVAP